jgi:small subunit ribosomal protein S18
MADDYRRSGGRSEGGPGGPRGKRRPTQVRTRRVCPFCAENAKELDYKQIDVLKRYVSERGQIRSRRKTSLCAKHQRRLAEAVKRARFMALLPYTGEHIRLYGSGGN